MTVGMSLDPLLIFSQTWELILVLAGYLTLKILIIVGLCVLFRVPFVSALRVGLILASGGEFVFVIIMPSVEAKIISPELGQMLFTLVAISMAMTPFLAGIGKWFDDKFSEKERENVSEAMTETIDLRNHIIIAGFGQIGKIIARLLTEKLVPFVIIDSNLQAVTEGRQNGFPIFFGDARRAEVMRTLGASKARAAIVCFKNEKAAFRASMMLRRQFQDLKVAMRLDGDEFEQKLIQAGISVVTPQHLEPSLRLAAKALQAVGVPPSEIDQTIDIFRKNYVKSS